MNPGFAPDYKSVIDFIISGNMDLYANVYSPISFITNLI